MILEFIRSRPPLKPASERLLSPPPKTEPSLHQKLMDGIKENHQLKPTPKALERKFDSYHLPRGKRYSAFSIYSKNVAVESKAVSPLRGRSDSLFQRLSFRNLSLRRTLSSYNLSPKSVVPPESSPVSTPSLNRVPFWRKLFNWS